MVQYPVNTCTPSRFSNPFATCWTRPGAILFQFPDGHSAEQLIARLADHDWRGAIVGPHGSGKSALLATLLPLMKAQGQAIVRWSEGPTAHGRSLVGVTSSAMVIVDGFEQLGRLARWRIRQHCQRLGAGLLVTTHVATSLPSLITLAPDLTGVQRLVACLRSQSTAATSVSDADVAASFARHGSNVREVLFDLYDRHERLSRAVANGLIDSGVNRMLPAGNMTR